MNKLIERKAFGTEPTYGTYWDTKKYSQIERINIFPYPFYFVSNPMQDYATVNQRRAGWSSQYIFPSTPVPPDTNPKHCFQAPCNTTYSKISTKEGCVSDKCINLER